MNGKSTLTCRPLLLGAILAIVGTRPAQSEVITSPSGFSPSATVLTFNERTHGDRASTLLSDQQVYVSIDNDVSLCLWNYDPEFFGNVAGHDYERGLAVAAGLIQDISFRWGGNPVFVDRVGFWLSTEPALSWRVSAYHDDELLGFVDVTMPGPRQAVFAGLEFQEGISRIQITRLTPAQNWIDLLDDLMFEVDATPVDSDNDGLTDTDEALYGTDPDNPDTDGDGLMDGTEVDMAEGTGCPDPLNPDSDGDGLEDGFEVALGTSPCTRDTDGDGVPDNRDPTPTSPGVPSSFVESELRILAAGIDTLPLSAFAGKTDNAAAGRRNALSNKVTAASNAVAAVDIDAALEQLDSLLDKIDGDPEPPDWMLDSAEKDSLAATVALLTYLLELP